MYWWKMKLLKKHLCENGLTEKQLFYYILIYVALGAIAVEMVGYMPHESPNNWTCVGSFASIAIPIVGTIMAFRANGGESGVQFAARYFSISLVASIRFGVLFIPVFVVLMVYWFYLYGLAGEFESSAFEIALFSVWYAGLYVYVVKSMREVATSSPEKVNL